MDDFERFKERLSLHPRICGVYLLEIRAVPPHAADDASREAFLREFASRLGFAPPDVGVDEWKHAEARLDEAKQELVHALVGGAEIGHSRWDVPPAEAQALAEEFLGLFTDDARFFCSRDTVGRAQCLGPYSRPDFFDYIFGGGCIAIDSRRAGVFWVLDND